MGLAGIPGRTFSVTRKIKINDGMSSGASEVSASEASGVGVSPPNEWSVGGGGGGAGSRKGARVGVRCKYTYE